MILFNNCNYTTLPYLVLFLIIFKPLYMVITNSGYNVENRLARGVRYNQFLLFKQKLFSLLIFLLIKS